MKWIKIKNPEEVRKEVPLNKHFFVFFRDVVGITEYNRVEDCFLWYWVYPRIQLNGGIVRLHPELEKEFTHYCIFEAPQENETL